MRKKTMEILINLGIPANISGFHYICDAMEMYEQDESYIASKLCLLYQEIAKKNNTTATSVERCIRHAFSKLAGETLNLIGGFRTDRQELTNGNLLACIYLTLKEM